MTVNFVSRKVRVDYDPQHLTLSRIYSAIKRLGYSVVTETISLSLGDKHIDSKHDVESMVESLLAIEGVVSATIDRNKRTVRLTFIPAVAAEKKVMKQFEQLGFRNPKKQREREKGKWFGILDFKSSLSLVSLVIVGVVVIERILGEHFFPQYPLLVRAPPIFGYSVSWAFIASIIFGMGFVRTAFSFFVHSKRLGMDALLSVAIIASLATGEDFAAIEVIGLTLLGEALESLTIASMRKNIAGLVGSAPTTASIRNSKGQVVEVPTSQVKAGDVVVVLGGQTIPVDGTVVSGESIVNEAPVTGESVPVKKAVGSRVFAGTINESGAIDVKATRVGSDTTVSRIVSLVEHAQDSKTSIQRVGEKFTTFYVPAVFIISGLVYLVTGSPIRAISLLIVACPCAIVLAVPTAVIAGLANAAGHGILVKGGAYLETIGNVDLVLTDKTGTLTFGRPRIKKIITLDPAWSRNRLMVAASIVAKNSRHPLSLAINDYAKFLNMKVQDPAKFRESVGAGITAETVNGDVVRLGNRNFVSITTKKNKKAKISQEDFAVEMAGDKNLFVSVNGKLVGVIVVSDMIRPHVRDAIEALRNEGIRDVVMLTGDNEESAKRVAEEAGIREFHANLLPAEKLKMIKKYKDEGHVVAMIGDGVNDAPALSLADVGIAMGAAGTDAAIETANIALMSDDLTLVVEAVMLSKKTVKTIKHNFVFAVLFNACGITLAGLGFLSPVFAAIVHNVSSLAVIANSTRLIRKQKIYNNEKFRDRVSFPSNCVFNQCSFGDGCVFSPNSRFSNNCTFGRESRFKNALDSKLDYGSFCSFRNNCAFGPRTRLGSGCALGSKASFGYSSHLGSYTSTGADAVFASGCSLESGSVIGPSSKAEDKIRLGPYSETGDDCSFGNYSEFASGCSFGKRNSFGDGCSFSNCRFAPGTVFGSGCVFGRYCSFPGDAKFGKNCVRERPYWVDGVLVRL